MTFSANLHGGFRRGGILCDEGNLRDDGPIQVHVHGDVSDERSGLLKLRMF